MAGHKINPKAKSKDDKGKSNRNPSPSNDDTEDPDFTILRKPIHTSVSGFAQARKVFDVATEELKSLLTNECDVLYECKVCRNIFRSLANFISHKRIYCKETFNTSVHGHFVRTLSTASEISKIKKIEELYKVSLNEEELHRKENADRIPLTKDLTEIIERLALAKGKQPKDETPEIVLQKIPKSNVAVFQSIKREDDDVDSMRAQVKELNTLMSRETAVLNSDGTVAVQSTGPPKKETKKTENVIQISDDEDQDEGDILKCKICDLQFSTQKTLKFHMKYKHLDSRLVYPCPDCLEIFSTSWSVYRHLFKVHRKTAAQIRRLRESIQAKAFKMNNPPAFYEKRKNNAKNTTPQKITEEERLDQENQAWMDNMEGDGEVPRCGGCGRTFERRAALAAHTHTCQPRSRALARRPDARKIEIQIRKDYNKAPPPPITLPLKIADSNDNKHVREVSTEKSKSPKEVEDESKVKDKAKKNTQDKSNDNLLPKQCADESQNSKNKSNENINTIKLPFARQTELNNFNAFRKHCLTDTEIEKLQCKKCDTKFSEDAELYEHIAEHFKWLRYACKLCNFKNYNFEKLPEHVKVVHKLKGDSDFYYSTVKAIDGTEALQLSDCTRENTEGSERSPDSRRPSRCSSDSSRLSDDSSCSSSRTEGKRKKRMKHNKTLSKKKKESIVTDDTDEHKDSEASNDMIDENYSSSNVKAFEENSSDIDEVDEKANKKLEDKSITTLSRRPVRKRTYKKNEDFEYDLSNLLKMEAQGYRDSQIVVLPKPVQPKKKTTIENQNNNEICNKNYSGAMLSLARKAVATSSAHMRCIGRVFQGDVRSTNVFLRPSLPKIPRVEKISPKKDTPIQTTDVAIPNNMDKLDAVGSIKLEKDVMVVTSTPKEEQTTQKNKEETQMDEKVNVEKQVDSSSQALNKLVNNIEETSKTIPSKLNGPANLLPVKLRRQSLDLIQNPLIKKNMSEFSKAGMKTKILVIKPINRNKDGGKTINTPLKFQTIKLKESIKSAISNKEISPEQVRVVQVPKVECALKLPMKNTCVIRNDTNLSTATSPNASSSDTSSIINEGKKPFTEEDNICDKEQQGELNINTVKESSSPDVSGSSEDVLLEQENEAISTES